MYSEQKSEERRTMKFDMILRKGFHYLNRQRIQEGAPETPVYMDCSVSPFQTADGLKNAKMEFEKIENEKVIFHCYWFGVFGRLQAASIASLAATQVSYVYEIWLWLDEEMRAANTNNQWLDNLPKEVKIKYYTPSMVKSIPSFRRILYLFEETKNLAFRGDGFRLWALHEFGGFYFDLDVMFLRDMGQLIRGPEFVYAWERQKYANNTIIYFRKNSWLNAYIVRKVRRIHSTQPWAVFGYNDKKLRHLQLLNASTFDPLWGNDVSEYPIQSFEEFFNKPVMVESMDEIFPYSYAYHWHNNWKAEIAENSLFAQLERRNAQKLEERV